MPLTQARSYYALLLLPLCSSSTSVGLAIFQYPVFSAFLASSYLAGRPLGHYWEPLLSRAVPVLVASSLTSVVCGLLTWRRLHSHGSAALSATAKLYLYGALLALTHYAFMPLVAGPIRTMSDTAKTAESGDEVEVINRRAQKRWFIWHTVRLMAVDVPALCCFYMGMDTVLRGLD